VSQLGSSMGDSGESGQDKAGLVSNRPVPAAALSAPDITIGSTHHSGTLPSDLPLGARYVVLIEYNGSHPRPRARGYRAVRAASSDQRAPKRARAVHVCPRQRRTDRRDSIFGYLSIDSIYNYILQHAYLATVRSSYQVTVRSKKKKSRSPPDRTPGRGVA
jgi:hypothetical protein